MISTLATTTRLVHRALRYRYRLNRPQIAAMMRMLPRGGVGFDVGAHKGAYSFWMARAVGRGGRVLAFEPQGRLAQRTAESLKGARLRQVRFFHAAVTDRCGRGTLTMRRDSTHGASVAGLDNLHGSLEREEVDLITIDEAAAKEGIERADFLKIDVEGHELAVFRGGVQTLERWRPAILVELELRHHNEHDPVAAAADLLKGLGYRGYFFSRGETLPLEEFCAKAHQRYGSGAYCNDFLFVDSRRALGRKFGPR